MASPDTHLVNKPQLSYDTSLRRRSLHALEKIKARTRLFRKAGPAVRGFLIDESYYLSYLKLVALIETHDNEEKQLEKDVLSIEGLSCVRCTLAFSSKDHLEKHSYFCGNPNIVAGDLKTLKKHKDLLQEQDGEMLLCPWCPILCLNMIALLKHVRSCREARRERDERQILRRLPCPECAREFSHLQKLSNHVQSHYVADYTCSVCDVSFSSAKYLAKHLTICRSKQLYRCCDCNNTFSNAKSLRVHVLSCRTNVQCLKCAKNFPGKNLCLEHVIEHIFSEWTKMGLQMLDGVLYKILRHSLPNDKHLEPSESFISPHVSPVNDPVKSSEKSGKASNPMANSRLKSPLELKSGLDINKHPSSVDKLLHLLHGVRDKNTGNNLSRNCSSSNPASVFMTHQSLETRSAESVSVAKPNCFLEGDDVYGSSDPMAPVDMPSADEDDLSVIENEEYEIEHTLDEDESEICDSELPLPTFKAGGSLRNSEETSPETHRNHSVVAELFTPAIDIESEDSNKLTLTVVNVEGGANLFDWDDCDSEEVNCGVTDIGEPQDETHNSVSASAETGNEVLLGADCHSDGNEDVDSGIGATDDNDSNKDRSEVPDKCNDVLPHHLETPSTKLLVVPEKFGEPPCPPVLSDIFVSSSSCDTEIVVESSPIIQKKMTKKYSLVIPRTYMVWAEHSYASPIASVPVASNSSVRVKCATEVEKNQKKTSKVCVSEHQGKVNKSHKQKKMKLTGSGISSKVLLKKSCNQNDQKLKGANPSLTEEDPLQKILEVMSKEARQTIKKKSKSSNRSRQSTPMPFVHSHPIERTTGSFDEQANNEDNVVHEHVDNISDQNVEPLCEDQTATENSLSHSQLIDSASQSSIKTNESVEAALPSDGHTILQEETEVQPLLPEIASETPIVTSNCTYQRSISRDEYMEKLKPPMSRNRILKKESSMLKHGFKQIATVLPQRKEYHGVKEVSIPKTQTFGGVKPPSLDNLLDGTSSTTPYATNISQSSSNIIYIQLPALSPTQRFTAIPQLVSSVIPRTSQPNVVYARLVPTAPITPSADSNSPSQSPVPCTFQIQQHPSEVVSALVNLGSDVRNQSTLTNTEVDESLVQLTPSTAVSAHHVSSSTGSRFNEAKGKLSLLKKNAPSDISGRHVFARIPPKNGCSSVNNLLDVSSTSLIDSNLNSQSVCSKENLPPNQAFHTSLSEQENEEKLGSITFQKSQQLETNHSKQDILNYRTNLGESEALIKSSSVVANLLDTASLPDSKLKSQSLEVTVGGKEDSTPAQKTALPSYECDDRKQKSAILQNLESNNLMPEVFADHITVLDENDTLNESGSAVIGLYDASGTPLSNSNINSQISEQVLCSKQEVSHVQETLLLQNDHNDLKQESQQRENIHLKNFEENGSFVKSSSVFADFTKENLPQIQEMSPNKHGNELKEGSTISHMSKPCELEKNHLKQDEFSISRLYLGNVPTLKSGLISDCSYNQLGAEKCSEVKAADGSMPNTIKCNLAEEEAKQEGRKNNSEMGLLMAPAPSLSHENDFEDVPECNDLGLDHEIQALISCLDSSIACEETRKRPENETMNFKELSGCDVPFTENLQTPLSENIIVDSVTDTDVNKDPGLKLNLSQSKSFQVCHMQLCDSKDQDKFSFNFPSTAKNLTDDKRLSQIEKGSISIKKKRTILSSFRTNMYASRKLMSEMQSFKRNRLGREGLHQRSSITKFNCNDCSQWFHSQVSLEAHTCLKSLIRGKFTSEEFDQLIDRAEPVECAQVEVSEDGVKQSAPQQIDCSQDQVTGNTKDGESPLCSVSSTQTNLSPYLSYLKMKTGVRHTKFICEKCKIRCKSFSALLEHKSSAHDEKYSVECHVCGKSFSRLQQLAVHVAKSHKVERNPSVATPVQSGKNHVIKRSLSSRTALRLVKRHKIHGHLSKAVLKVKNQPSMEEALHGPSQEAAAHISESQTAHIGTLKESDDPNTHLTNLPGESTTESKISPTYERLGKEIPVIAGGSISIPDGRDTQCSICSKYFKGRAGLTSHMVQAHRESTSPNIEDDITQCSICNKLFKGKGGLTSHMNQAHRETFKCPLCFRRFCYIQTLKYHLAKQHSSSLNTDALVIETIKPADHMELSPSKVVCPENTKIQNDVASLVSSSSAENSPGTLDSKDDAGQITSSSVSLQERNIKKAKKTKWKFVRDISPVKTACLEQLSGNDSEALAADNNESTSLNQSNMKKPKKIKWRIVKDMSPEKNPSTECPAKSPRLSDSIQAPVPSLVISLSKVKKHRYKCRICKKEFKKHQHLLQHQIGAHKFRSQLQPQSHVQHCKSINEELLIATSAVDPATLSVDPTASAKDPATLPVDPTASAKDPATLPVDPTTSAKDPATLPVDPTTSAKDSATLPEDPTTPAEVQHSYTQVATSNCCADGTLEKIDLCIGNPEKGQSQSESIASATNETNTFISATCFSGEKSVMEQTNFPNPSNVLAKEETSSHPASSVLSETPKDELSSSPLLPNSHSDKFECKICQLEFSAKGYLERHNIKSHGAPCKFGCSICGKIFVDIRSLRFHKKLKHKVNEQGTEDGKTRLPLQSKPRVKIERKCEHCNKTFFKRDDLRNHIRRVHKARQNFKCDLCCLCFGTKLLLDAHNFETHGERSKGTISDPPISPQKSNNANQEILNDLTQQSVNQEDITELKKTPEDLQEELAIYKCIDCPYIFKKEFCLKRHRIRMHGEQATHQCDVCGKRFSYAHSLKSHKFVHSKNEPKRKSLRILRNNCALDGIEEPRPKCEENEVTQDKSTAAIVEQETELPIIPSETIAKNEVSHTSDASQLEENVTVLVTLDKMSDQDTRSNTTPLNEDFQPSPPGTSVPAENTSHQEIESFTYTDRCVPETYNPPSTPNCSVPVENHSSSSYLHNDVSTAPFDCVNDPQWMSAPQIPQYQTVPLPAPTIPPLPEPSTTPSYNQMQGFNACTLCGLCLPSWYALQEHYYMFHSYPNYYTAPTPSAPTPYPAPVQYSAFPNQNAAYHDWTLHQHQLANIAPSPVLNNGAASFQELTSHSGAHCSVCGLVFSSLYALQEHYGTHMAASKTPVQYSGAFY